MNHTSLTAKYISHSPTQGQSPQKQVELSATVEANFPPPSSHINTNTNTNSNINTSTGGNLKEPTESKHRYLSALRSAASAVQKDINALLTAEMQADKIREMTADSTVNGKGNARSNGRPDAKQTQGESRHKAKGTRADESPDDDDGGFEGESDEDM